MMREGTEMPAGRRRVLVPWRRFGPRRDSIGPARPARMALRSLAPCLTAGLLAHPVAAQDGDAPLFQVPPGCTAYVTVQLRNCQVAHQYRCAGDAPGDQWSVFLDGQGAYFATKIDAETRWIESVDMETGETDTLGPETDPASFSVLLRSGRDDFDFFTESTTGEVLRFVGYDQLTGGRAVIDGVPLERTTFSLTAYNMDGSLAWKREGQQFIHRDWRIFYSDRETFENGLGERFDTTDAPVEFDFPGDKGFLTTEPKFDCDVLSASLEVP